ncbi:2'-5' RNA ligase family protein [Sporosarcina sp. PTS2304]|uniref:2'-5' RNA ligase family protein n=1 Tax=Sporosarcina sp. PTS2304 TaxID=2283194 RepID=UPI000E0D5A2C|nr:2'-5' RNA ligase family protein [Sporosarcina sp. PTS2304]AXI00946.1 2'-5' RNA ligase family protein [Sporosarcina sp. PTS2304]
MDCFSNDTYIVLDLPKHISEKVKIIRENYNYPDALPAEITLTGSSGVGVFLAGQDQSRVFEEVDKIANKTKPVKVSFSNVLNFPNTNIFFFTIKNEEILREIHLKISDSQINFKESPFPYKPHCTLCNLDTILEEEKQGLLSINLTDEFTLDTLSVYSLQNKTNEDVKVSLLHRVKLSG